MTLSATATDISIHKKADGNFTGSALAWRDGVSGMVPQGRFSATVERILRPTVNDPEKYYYALCEEFHTNGLVYFYADDKGARKVLRAYFRAVGQLNNDQLKGYLEAVAILSE